MTEEKSQVLNISGGQLSGIQIGQAGRDLAQSQQIIQNDAETHLTASEVVNLIAQIETLFSASDLPGQQKEKALKHLDSAKEEAKNNNPDKDFAAKSLQRATKVLKETNEAVGAGQGIWQKLEPLATKLAPWFGMATKALLGI